MEVENVAQPLSRSVSCSDQKSSAVNRTSPSSHIELNLSNSSSHQSNTTSGSSHVNGFGPQRDQEHSSASTPTDIVTQGKQESDVLSRIANLRKEGMWSASRLPKVHEPPRRKCHQDYLLEEMEWLATDFFQERKWKRRMAKKLCRAVVKYHQDRGAVEERQKRDEVNRLKRIASTIAKDV